MHQVFLMILVFVGGGFGSVTRFAVAQALESTQKPAWIGAIPLPTFVINIVGSFLIGCIVSLAGDKISFFSKELRLLFGVGFCGGFTTFSAFSLENVSLLHSGKVSLALLYSMCSVVLGLIFCAFGIGLTHWIAKRWFGV